MTDSTELLKKWRKDHGANIATVGDAGWVDIPRIQTGVFPVDLATGGGFPMGKLSIVYGPESSNKTNLMLGAIREGQKAYPDKMAAIVDAEHEVNIPWCKQLGLDTDRLIVLHPDYAEQAVDMVESLIYAKDIFLVGLDSIAALAKQSEVDASAEKGSYGGASILVGRMTRKAVVGFSKMARENIQAPALICINQIRMKMDAGPHGNPECLHADTLVNFVDGRSIPIRQVVEQKIDAPIWAFNEDTKTFFESRIISHHYNGEANSGDFLVVSAQGVDTKNGVFSATVTYTHKFLTFDGWKTAGELQVGELLLTKYRSVISGTVKDFLAGALCGDATLFRPNAGLNCGIKFQDSQNPDYAAWKARLLERFFNVSGSKGTFVVSPTYDLGKFGEQFAGTRHPQGLFNNFSWLGFAIWIMDDGHYSRSRYTLSIGRFKEDTETKEYISECLQDLGLNHSWSNKNVVFTAASSKIIAAKCRQYAPECMEYKFPGDLGGTGFGVHLTHAGVKFLPTYTPIISVGQASPRKYRDTGLYDLHIEGHHNYLAGNMDNGFVVHNTMPGGMAQKFAASLILRTYGKNVMESKLHKVLPAYKECSVIVKKWKVPILSMNAEYKMQMIAAAGNPAGFVADWNTISAYMKELDYLAKAGDKPGMGWLMSGEKFLTLEKCREALYADAVMLQNMKATLIAELLEKGSASATSEGDIELDVGVEE